MLQVAGGDGDGEGRVEIAVRRWLLVDVRLLFGQHRMEGRGRHRLVVGKVHQRVALVVAARGAVRCGEEKHRHTNRTRILRRQII